MDVLMSCSVRDGIASWRQVFTMGGGMYDGSDISAFLSAIASGLPGKYVLRLSGAGMHFLIATLNIHPYQDVRFISTATEGSRLIFGGHVTVAIAGGLMIRGEGSLRAFEEPSGANSTAASELPVINSCGTYSRENTPISVGNR